MAVSQYEEPGDDARPFVLESLATAHPCLGLLWSLHFPALTDADVLAQNGGVNFSNGNPSVPDQSGKLAVVLLCVFALPFAGFGLFAMSQAIRLLSEGSGNPPFWYPLLFGLVFSSVGFGLMTLVIIGTKRYSQQQRLQVENPGKPWLWRPDWAQGRINSKTHADMIASWVFAIFWNMISAPIAWFVLPAALKQKGPAGYFVLIFPAAGVLLLTRAIRTTMASLEFGKTYFEMASVPGVIGRELKGSIQARFPHSPDHGVHLRLSCVHRMTTGSGNSQSTQESILWRDEIDLNSGQLCPGPAGTTIPVAFRIPIDAHPTETVNARDSYLWLLEALADVPGVNYHDAFDVPVFRTADTPSQPEPGAARFSSASPSATRPDHLTVEVLQTAEGCEFYFPPARNKSFAMSTTVFAAIFGSVTYFLAHFRAPFIFPMAFGLFSLLLVYITGQLWLGTTRVVIGPSLKLRVGLLGGGRVQEIALADIASIGDKITAQQGGGSGTPYYDIEMTLRNGKKLTLGRSLANKREAEWLVSEMQRLAGLNRKTMSAGMA